MIDTHSHIYLEHFDNDIQEVILRAKDIKISKILLPNIDKDTIDSMLKLVSKYPELLFPMIGLHPSSVKSDFKEHLKTVETEIETGRYIAVGEMGIDLYWDKTFLKEQIEAFHFQIKLAIQYNLPIVIHMRDSFSTIKSELLKYPIGNLRGVFHCFTGTHEQAEWIINRGFYLGIGGVVSFKNSDLPQQLLNIPIDKILLETDSPYLAPVPYRGKRNEPAYIKYTAEKIADIYSLKLSEIISITDNNAKTLFNFT
jgi:TatD DNase family protein